MLGVDRRAARYTWTAALVLLLLGVVYLIRETLLVFILALFFAYLLWPVVKYLDKYLPGRSRTPALVIVYSVLVLLIVLLGIEISSRVVEQAKALSEKWPSLLSKLEQPSSVAPPHSLKYTIISVLRTQFQQYATDLGALLPEAGLKVMSVARVVLFVVLVPILSFFFLKDGHQIRSAFEVNVAEESRRDLLREIAADLNVLLAQYMRALLLVGLVTFTAYSLFLSLIGVSYAVLLAAIAGLLEFIPVVGPFVTAVTVLLVAGFSGFHHLLWLIIFFAVYRILLDYIFIPRLMSAEMELHPLLVIFGVLAGGQIGGVGGAFLSVPVLATLRVVYRRIRGSPDAGLR